MSNASQNRILILAAISAVAVLASCGRRDRPKVDLRQKEDPRTLKAFGPNEDRFCSFEFPYSEKTDASAKGEASVLRVTVLGDSKTDLATNLSATCAKLDAAPRAECEKFVASNDYPCVAPSILNAEPMKPGLWTCTLPFTANDVDEVIPAENQSYSTPDAAISALFIACAELTDGEKTEPVVPDSADGRTTIGDDSTVAADELTNLALTIQTAPSPVPGAPPAPPSPRPSATPSPTPTVAPVRTYTIPSKRRDACAAALLAEKIACTNTNDYPAVTPSPKPPRRLHH